MPKKENFSLRIGGHGRVNSEVSIYLGSNTKRIFILWEEGRSNKQEV